MDHKDQGATISAIWSSLGTRSTGGSSSISSPMAVVSKKWKSVVHEPTSTKFGAVYNLFQ